MHHPQAPPRQSVAQSAVEILARLRVRRPRVHCITNTVAQNFTANALLAAGCQPSMTVSGEEVGSFVSGAQGLLVNLGTFDKERREAITIALDAARSNALPSGSTPMTLYGSPSRRRLRPMIFGSAPNCVCQVAWLRMTT